MRMRAGDLRQVLLEARIGRMDTYLELLYEDGGSDSQAHAEGASGDSLDNQVDRYLAQYEGEAKKADGDAGGVMDGDTGGPNAAQMESIDWRDLVKGVIIEAGEGDKNAEQPEVPGEEPEKLGMDSLDVAKFADSIVRLIENYDSLLEVRSTLIRRARSFLDKTYSEDVVKAYEDVLRDDHGLEAGSDKGTLDAEKYPAPAAARAAGSAEPGVGGAGGGGAP